MNFDEIVRYLLNEVDKIKVSIAAINHEIGEVKGELKVLLKVVVLLLSVSLGFQISIVLR